MQNMVQTFQDYFEEQGYKEGYAAGCKAAVLQWKKQYMDYAAALAKQMKLNKAKKSLVVQALMCLDFSQAEAEKIYSEA